jgi:hypothetical protein
VKDIFVTFFGIMSVGFDISTIHHIFCIPQILEKKWENSERVHLLFINFKKACNSVRKEVLYNIHTEFGVPVKLVRLIKMPFFIVTDFQLSFTICHLEGPGKSGETEIEWDTSASGLC